MFLVRTALLGVACCLLLAGCISTMGGEATTNIDPECKETTEYEPREIPDPPSNITADTAATYAETHAEALAWNEGFASAQVSLRVNGDATVVNQTDSGYLVYVSGGVSEKHCEHGSVIVGDGGFAATYFINETEVVRLNLPENSTDDPRENGGEVITETPR
jgi:hypothetical protein